MQASLRKVLWSAEYNFGMDRLWTPWRYNYISGASPAAKPGVPPGLEGWPGEDQHCVFCNLIASVEWGLKQESGAASQAEKAGLIVARPESCFVCLNAFPYSSGHLLVVPYRHTDSLAKLTLQEARDLITTAQRMEAVLSQVYKPDGINLGLNLGEAAGAGVANHLHFHMLPRWFGDTNFMTVTSETRILPETLDVTWTRVREAFQVLTEKPPTQTAAGG